MLDMEYIHDIYHNGLFPTINEKVQQKYDSRHDTIDDTRGRIQVAYTF